MNNNISYKKDIYYLHVQHTPYGHFCHLLQKKKQSIVDYVQLPFLEVDFQALLANDV